MEGQATTMEIDAETSAMDTNDEGSTSGQGCWKDSEPSDMNADLDLPIMSGLCGMVGTETSPEIHSRLWQLPEGTCHKRTVRKGEGMMGPVCGACCTVTLHMISGSCCDVDESQLGYPPGDSRIQIGEGGTPLSCLIDSALMFMKKGELAEVCVSGLKQSEGEFVFHITLHDFTSATPPWRLTPAEKRSSAAAHKEKGARLFKEGNIYAAFAQFRSATRLLLSILPLKFEEDEEAGKCHQQLLCQCYLNLAACQMKSGHHNHVVTNCTQVLRIDPTNVKALYRRASANVSLGNYLLAQEDLEAGLGKEPHNRALLDLVHSVNSKLAASQSQMAQGLSKMFS
ncbi:hypothetical protein ACOMHN_043213 [Nucella lapillus]